MTAKRLPTRYPLQRFLMLSLLFVVGIITHTLLTDPHLGRVEADQSIPAKAALEFLTARTTVSPDASIAADKLLGVEIRVATRRLTPGTSLRLEFVGTFVSGTVPIVATWTQRIAGNSTTSILGCEGRRSDCTVRGAEPGVIKITAQADGHEATTTLTVTGGDGNLFRDAVPAWADTAVQRLFDAGIIQGYDDGRFGPADTLTHGQVLTLLVRLLREAELVPPAICTPPFSADHYAAAAYCQFLAAGWISQDETFTPDAPVTRGQTAAYVRRILQDPTIAKRITMNQVVPGAPIFTDIPVGHAAFADTAAVHALGIMVGHPDGRFGFAEFLNRAEAAVLMHRLRDLL